MSREEAKPSDGLEPSTPSMKKGRASRSGCRIARSWRVLPRSGLWSWAHLSIASSREDKADGSSLRWRISLRTVRRPGDRWRVPERRVGRG
jgi:hypothetical protein